MFKKYYTRLAKEITHHQCQLDQEEPPIIRYIDNGYFVYFRRFIRNSMLVSEKNPGSHLIFQSKASIRRETERHLQEFYSVIHPYSYFIFWWEVVMTYLTMVAVVAYPMLSFAHGLEFYICVYTKYCVDFVYLVDILIQFNCGYLNKNTNRVHLNRTQLAKHYLKTWFLLDLVCTFNIDLYLLHRKEMHILWIKQLNYLRILRMASLIKYLNRYREFLKFKLYKYNFFRAILLMLVLLLWLTSFLFMLTEIYPESWCEGMRKSNKIVTCLYRVAYLFFLVGFGERYSTQNPILLFEMLCWMIGIVIRFLILAEIVQIVSNYNAVSNKYHRRVQRLRHFMRKKGLPSVTCNRIIQYFDFRFQRTFYKEDEILSTLSPQLQNDIVLQSTIRLIQNVMIFKDLPTAVVMRLVTCMKSTIFLPNDVIVNAGTSGKHMYFIHNGTVAIFTAAGVEVCHLTDGCNFGEVALVMKEKNRIATVVAIDSCELYILSRDDFEKAIEPYPDLYNRIRVMAEDRVAKTMGGERLSDLINEDSAQIIQRSFSRHQYLQRVESALN